MVASYKFMQIFIKLFNNLWDKWAGNDREFNYY